MPHEPESCLHPDAASVARWIRKPCFDETTVANDAAIAFSARHTAGAGIVATECQREIDAEVPAETNNLRLRFFYQRSLNIYLFPLDARFGSNLCETFEGCYKFGSAIGVAGVIDSVGAYENRLCVKRLGPQDLNSS